MGDVEEDEILVNFFAVARSGRKCHAGFQLLKLQQLKWWSSMIDQYFWGYDDNTLTDTNLNFVKIKTQFWLIEHKVKSGQLSNIILLDRLVLAI